MVKQNNNEILIVSIKEDRNSKKDGLMVERRTFFKNKTSTLAKTITPLQKATTVEGYKRDLYFLQSLVNSNLVGLSLKATFSSLYYADEKLKSLKHSLVLLQSITVSSEVFRI
jgi:hypothetical protein